MPMDELFSRFSSKAHEFPKDSVWLNTAEPLVIERLKGNVVVLDFWTYCCINCMHMVPTLEKLEETYKGRPVAIIGVHSAKFENEKDPKNISEAIGRYGIRHPVVVDRDMRIWKEYGVNAWPTVVVIDPQGRIIYKRSGEIPLYELAGIVDLVLEESGKAGALAHGPPDLKVPSLDMRTSLSYPGKISFSPDSRTFALSDSGNNRILLVETGSGKVIDKIGNGERGMRDGGFSAAGFFRPQGVLWHDKDTIFVADTDNHAIRMIDLKSNEVVTLAGTGRIGGYVGDEYSGDGRSTDLNSPWDMAVYGNRLIIAMAGLHQLWSYDLAGGKVSIFAGSGREGIFDGTLKEAEFAQSSGLHLSGKMLYVADSEVSAIRSVDLEKGYVSTLVGAGLFVFGYKDGSLYDARLQHPLGVCASDNGNLIYVADSYNSAIRMIDAEGQSITTVIGNPSAKSMCRFDDPDCDTLGLYEPSDVKLSADGNTLYIVDTNNHLVREFDIDSGIMKTLDIKT